MSANLDVNLEALVEGSTYRLIKVVGSPGQHCSIHQKVVGSIPGQDTYLGCGFNPLLGHVWEGGKRSMFLFHIDVSLSPPPPSFSPSSSLSKISKYILR